MDERTEKRLIAFASQSVRQYGIRAVRMDTIARDMGVSKRTLYKEYKSKDNFIRTCLESYVDRVGNLFRLLRLEATDPLEYLCALTRAFVDNLYKAELAFWLDITEHYPHVYETIWGIWMSELETAVGECLQGRWLVDGLDPREYVSALSTLFYQARMAGSPSQSVAYAAYLMLRGSMTMEGILRL